MIRDLLLRQRKSMIKSRGIPPRLSDLLKGRFPPCITPPSWMQLDELYFVRYDRRNSGASRGIRTLDTWFRRPSNENDKLYGIQRIRYHRISCRSYAVPFSFRELSGRQLRPTLRPAISFPSHTGAPFRCA